MPHKFHATNNNKQQQIVCMWMPSVTFNTIFKTLPPAAMGFPLIKDDNKKGPSPL